jgi:hypothetical protein
MPSAPPSLNLRAWLWQRDAAPMFCLRERGSGFGLCRFGSWGMAGRLGGDRSCPANTAAFFVVESVMTNDERNIIISVWNDQGLRMKLEDDPYSLTQDELRSLKNNDALTAMLFSDIGACKADLGHA